MHDKNNNSFFNHRRHLQILARIARKVRPGQFRQAQGYFQRDEIARLLAEECYEFSVQFAAEKKFKLSLQYMKLSARLLGLSLRPKKLGDLDEIKKALAKMKEQKDPTVV